MKNHKCFMIFVSISLVIIALYFCYPYVAFIDWAIPVSNVQIKKEYEDEEKTFQDVANYLQKQKFDSISISRTESRGKMFTDYKWVIISDVTASNQISSLLDKHGIDVIIKETENGSNFICFQRWANKDTGKGLLYSSNGKFPNVNDLTKIEQLSGSKWFIYSEK